MPSPARPGEARLVIALAVEDAHHVFLEHRKPRRALLARPDEGVRAYVGCGSTVEPVQSFLGARKISGQRQGGAIFLGRSLLVPLFFKSGAQQVVGLEGRSFFHFGIQGQITAQILDSRRESCGHCAAELLPTP